MTGGRDHLDLFIADGDKITVVKCSVCFLALHIASEKECVRIFLAVRKHFVVFLVNAYRRSCEAAQIIKGENMVEVTVCQNDGVKNRIPFFEKVYDLARVKAGVDHQCVS